MGNIKLGKYSILFTFTDLLCIFISFFIAHLLIDTMIGFSINKVYPLLRYAIITSAIFIASQHVFGFYNFIWKKASLMDYFYVFFSVFLGYVLSLAMSFIAFHFSVSLKLYFVAGFLSEFFIIGTRVLIRFCDYFSNYIFLKKSKENQNKVLIVGAGTAAKMLVEDIMSKKNKNYNIVGFIDDDKLKTNTVFFGYKVLGTREDIPHICKSNNVKTIILAIPSSDKKTISQILEYCSQTNCIVKMVPNISELYDVTTNGIFHQTRTIEFEDILDRDPISLDNKEISSIIRDKVVLVTGGGGSIGSELCRQVAKFSPKKLVILDIYENTTYDTQLELQDKCPDLDLEIIIASIRDENKMDKVFDRIRPNIVLHAAAHKHVPLMEDCPDEAIDNNIIGTYVIATTASKYEVEKFIMVSTDKAVNPTNVMGATKRFCEAIVQSINEVSKTDFACVRFGNVLGSHGSVIPLFKKQIKKGGPVTVTHPDITRFFMTIPEAAQLILQAACYAKNGEIFVLDMGEPVKIYDLAVKYIKLLGYTPNVDIDIKFIGLRPGEKLYEELLMNEEGLSKTLNQSIFIGKATFDNFEEIKVHIENFKKIVSSKNKEEIIEYLHKAVPTYTSPSIYNNLDR